MFGLRRLVIDEIRRAFGAWGSCVRVYVRARVGEGRRCAARGNNSPSISPIPLCSPRSPFPLPLNSPPRPTPGIFGGCRNFPAPIAIPVKPTKGRRERHGPRAPPREIRFGVDGTNSFSIQVLLGLQVILVTPPCDFKASPMDCR